MGGAVSVDGGGGRDRGVEEMLEFDDTSTLYISISSDTEKAFSKIVIAVKVSDDKSVLAIPVDNIMITGYSWSHGQVARPEDDEKNIAAEKLFPPEQKSLVLEQCKELGLFSRYTECFAKPDKIHPDKIFMNVRLEVRSPDKTTSYSELSGCVLKSDLEREADPEVELDRGSWYSHLKDLLPGERFESYRHQTRESWKQVERVVEAAGELPQTHVARADFYDYSKRQSVAYQQLLEKGVTTPDGERLIREIEHMKRRCHQAAHLISTSVLGTMFGKGEELLPRIIKRDTLGVQVRLEELKKRLQLKFENDIFSLAEYLSSKEAEAWERLNERFKSTDSSTLQEKLMQHEVEEKSSRRMPVTIPPSIPEKVDSETGEGTEDRGRKTRMQRQSSFGKREDGRRRTLSPSNSFNRGRSVSPRPPVMRRKEGCLSPRPEAPSASPVPAAPVEEKAVEEKPKAPVNRRQYRRSFTIQPVESFSSATAEVVEICKQKSTNNIGGDSGGKSASSLSALLNLSNAAANASKRRLAQRLALQKAQKSREQDAGFMLRSTFDFEYLLFEALITEKMTDYMEKELQLLQNNLATRALKDAEEMGMRHKKELAHALTENKSEEETNAIRTGHEAEKERLDNKWTEKKRAKLTAFEDARVVTMEKLAGKLAHIREMSTDATLSPAGIAKIQHIFRVFTTLRSETMK